LKKPAGSARFRFYKQKTEKTEPEPTKNQKKPSQTEPNQKNRAKPKKPRKPSQNRKNRAKPVWTGFCPKKPNRNRLVWPGFGFFQKKFGLVIFLIKTEPNKKYSPLLTLISHFMTRFLSTSILNIVVNIFIQIQLVIFI